MRLKDKLAGMFPPLKWNKEIQPLKSIVEREDANSLAADEVLGIVREMDERSQRKMAIVLRFPFAQRTSKSWPEQLFIKSVRTALQEANQDLFCKRRIVLTILQEIEPILEHEARDLEKISHQIAELAEKYGVWHMYWATYLHPDRDLSPDQWKADLQRLRELACNDPSSQTADAVREMAASASSTFEEIVESDSDSPHVDQVRRHPRKISLLEAKLHRETALRQKLELENAGLGKTIRQLERKIEQLEHQQNIEMQRAARAEHEVAAVEQRLYDEQQLRREELTRWRSEREAMLQQNHQHKRALDESHLAMEQIKSDHQRYRETAERWQQALHSAEQLAERLDEQLRVELSQLARTLATDDVVDHQGRDRKRHNRAQRQKMRTVLDLLDAIEAYQDHDGEPDTAETTVDDTESKTLHAQEPIADSLSPQHVSSVKDNVRSAITIQDRSCHSPDQSHDSTRTGTTHTKDIVHTAVDQDHLHTGTFYRRDHGGYIILDNDQTFNLPESLVNTLELQHEAEVQCRPYTQENGSVYYEVETLFQGDDTYAPIMQYDGYVELGEHHTYYCVDLNDPANRFPLHRKDFEIQQPADGTPCTFNVSVDGQFARLSRLYRDFGTAEDGQDSDDQDRQHRPSMRNNRKDHRAPVQKPEPFLEGCTITILGGQRKWFEDIVTETGAELIHDTGETPDRATSALRRSHALFLLLTSISHRASWEGIEIAKSYGIPHFTIQGSKSNLRMLLWDNQELIRSGASNS